MSADKLKCEHCGQAIPHPTGIVADPDRCEVRFRGMVAYLTGSEFAMFRILFERFGRVVSKEAFLDQMYQLTDKEPDIKIIDVFICKMRKKLKRTGLDVRTWWGRGYSLEQPTKPGESDDDAVEDTDDFDGQEARPG